MTPADEGIAAARQDDRIRAEAATYRIEAARLRRIAPKLEPEARQAARTYARRLLRWAKRAERKA